MVEKILDLEETIQTLLQSFEEENKVAITGVSLERINQTEDSPAGQIVSKLHFFVPYNIEY